MFKKIKELLFTNQNIKQTIIKNTIWLTGSTIISRSVRALVIIYAARILGTEGYGVFSYALSLAAFFTIFSDLGLSALLTREVSKNPEKKSAYISTIFFVKALILIATIIFTFLFAKYFVKIEAVKPLLPIAVLLVLFDNIRNFGFSFARARNQMEIEGILSVATDILITTLGLLALFLIPSTFNLTLAYTLGSAIGAIMVFLLLRKSIFSAYTGFDPSLIKPILVAASPFVFMGVFGAFMINIDTIIIGFFRSASELGLYAAAQRPIQLLYVIPALLASSIFPIINKFESEQQNEKTKIVLEKSVASVLLLAFPLVVGGIILAPQLIHFLFGVQYLGSILCFQLLLITFLFIFPGTIIGNTIFSYNLEKKLIYTTGLGALTNVILDFLFIPHYGISGSAVATVISQIITNGANWIILQKHIPFSVFPKIKKIVIASFLMGIITLLFYFFHTPFFLNLIISIISYGVFLMLLRDSLIHEFLKTITQLFHFPQKKKNI